LSPKVQRTGIAAHHRDEFAMDNFDESLAGSKASLHLFAERACAHSIDKRLDHRNRNIRFQQRHPYLAQRVLDIVVAQPALAAQSRCGLAETFAQILKHR
jgi:hypothetical protein